MHLKPDASHSAARFTSDASRPAPRRLLGRPGSSDSPRRDRYELPRERQCAGARPGAGATEPGLELARAVVRVDGKSDVPKPVKFPDDAQINRRLVDERLWPEHVTSSMVATLYRFSGVLLRRQACKSYSINGAADAIAQVLKPVDQMLRVEPMRAAQTLLANVLVLDEAERDAVQQALRDRHDPAA